MATQSSTSAPSAFGAYLQESKTYLRSDFLSSIVVFLVALPLCIGISVAVGVNPALGLITGIIGGLVVGTIAGSPLQVSGPAAILLVVSHREEESTLEEILPFYTRRLRYYQRLYASALSRSMRGSVILGDQRDIRARDWRLLLPRIERVMLTDAR